MQAPVAVGLGVRDPVTEPFGILLVLFRHESEHFPAEFPLQLEVIRTVDDEADREHVEDAFERDLLLDHLGPDGVGGLGADLQLVLDAGFRKLHLQGLDELRHQLFPVLLGSLQLVGDEAVLLRFRVAEVDVLHLPLHVVQAQLVRQRDVQHQGFQDLPLAVRLRKDGERAHHLQAVRQLEDGHARVRRVLDDQFLVVLGLEAGVLGLDGGNLVQAVHHRIDAFVQLQGVDVQVHLPAPRGFVQEHGGDALGRQADLVGDDLRDGERMPEEGRPVAAGLAGEGLFGQVVGLPDQFTALVGIMREEGVVHKLALGTRIQRTLEGAGIVQMFGIGRRKAVGAVEGRIGAEI